MSVTVYGDISISLNGMVTLPTKQAARFCNKLLLHALLGKQAARKEAPW